MYVKIEDVVVGSIEGVRGEKLGDPNFFASWVPFNQCPPVKLSWSRMDEERIYIGF